MRASGTSKKGIEMKIGTPFHEGELEVQERLGVRRQATRNSVVITDSIIKGALPFIAQQHMAVMGSIDSSGNVWASILSGQPGFMQAKSVQHITFDLSQSIQNSADPFWLNIETDPHIGMLVIELATRRRLRVNGIIHKKNDRQLELTVLETFPNCPKYIQRRNALPKQLGQLETSTITDGKKLGPEQVSMIKKSDTLFVASAHAERGVDASHRGGNPGFVQVLDEHTLRIPDYLGNSLFNTLGNFTANPNAGLVFVDFTEGTTLQVIGKAKILWDEDDPKDETGGTKRFWKMKIERFLQIQKAHEQKWEFLDYSPHNPIVGK